MPPSGPPRKKRADAVRNRTAILRAAASQIASHGLDIGMSEIAKSAGVAVGTLYRHFPTKTSLVAAVMAGYANDIAADAQDALSRARANEDVSPLSEIVGFLERVTESTAKIHAVKAVAAGLGVPEHGDPEAEAAAAAAVKDLLALAKEAGEIDSSITLADIYLLVGTAPVDQPVAARRRWMELMVAGLIKPHTRPRRSDLGG